MSQKEFQRVKVIELVHFPRAGRDLVKLLGVSTVGAFHGAIEFRGAGREHEQVEAVLLAGLLELSGELTAAIDLNGPDGKGHAVQQSLQELAGGESCGAAMGLDDVPAGRPRRGR